MGMFDHLVPQGDANKAGGGMFDQLVPKSNGSPLSDLEGASAKDKDIGQGAAAIFGAIQGATANFGDELAGLTTATQAKLAKFIYQNMTGDRSAPDNSFGGVYEKARDDFRATAKIAQEQYPVTSTVGNVGGAVASVPGRLLQAATLPGRMARGAAVGGVYGAAAGAGGGETTEQRIAGAASGGAVGGAVGLAAPWAVEGIAQAGRQALSPITTGLRGALQPEAEAARRVASSLERDVRNDPNAVSRLTPQEFAASRGDGATVMDMGGETTRALARSAANTSTEGRAALNQTVNDRFEGQGPRITEWLRGAFNFPNAHAQQQALEQTQRATNNVAYATARRDGAGGIWSPELERLAGSDAVTAAMQKAATNAKDEAIVSGYGAMNPRITFTQDGRIQFNRGPNGVPTYPDLQYWDLTRRELSDAARRAGPGTSESRRLNNFATAMNAELDRLVPSYQQARAGAAGFFQAENALEAGQNYVMQNFATPATRQALARMSAPERQLFQDGFVSRYIETLERTGDRRNILNQVAANPAAREKLQVALGPQRAAELEARLRVEGIMDLARGSVQGNSTTARQLAELGFAGGAGSLGAYGTYNLDPAQMTTAAVMGALLAGRRNIDQRVARQVAVLLTSNDPARLQRGIQLVARNNRLMDNLRSTDQRIAAVGGQQGAGAPAMQGPMPARTEDEQQ